jgi:hypothetical protein
VVTIRPAARTSAAISGNRRSRRSWLYGELLTVFHLNSAMCRVTVRRAPIRVGDESLAYAWHVVATLFSGSIFPCVKIRSCVQVSWQG